MDFVISDALENEINLYWHPFATAEYLQMNLKNPIRYTILGVL